LLLLLLLLLPACFCCLPVSTANPRDLLCGRREPSPLLWWQAEIADDDVQVDEEATGKTGLDAYSEYMASAALPADGADELAFDTALGLCIEKLPPTITTEKLWSLFTEPAE
jgi:hypothetical protein